MENQENEESAYGTGDTVTLLAFFALSVLIGCSLVVGTVKVGVDGKHRRAVETMRRNHHFTTVTAQVTRYFVTTHGSDTLNMLVVVYSVPQDESQRHSLNHPPALVTVQKSLSVSLQTYRESSQTMSLQVDVLRGFPLSAQETQDNYASAHMPTIVWLGVTLMWFTFSNVLLVKTLIDHSKISSMEAIQLALLSVGGELAAVTLAAMSSLYYFLRRRVTETFADYVARDMQGDARIVTITLP
eukprot:scaffold25204_cov193-Amphora_coffeaeformis.AAC.7